MEKQNRNSQYKFSQIFGYKGPNEKVQEEDIISVVRFDPTGKCLALGDRAGRVIVFAKSSDPKAKDEQFEYLTEFQSHCRQFDPLRSADVEEDITDMTWLKPQGKYMKMLTTNTNTIKLWKIFNKEERQVVKHADKDLSMPKMHTKDSTVTSMLQQTFPQRHQTLINSVCASNNEEYILSSDEVQTYLWSIEDPKRPYIVADMKKGQKIEDVKQQITCSILHPTSDSLFVYGTNKGSLKLTDMRCNSARDDAGVRFKLENPAAKNFFTEYVDSYSGVEMLKGGRYVATRDFLTVKVWDVACARKPVTTVVLQETMKGKLCEMFESENIFDKFKLSASPDGNTLVTGTYNNCFHAIDTIDGSNVQYELNYKKMTSSRTITPGKGLPLPKMDYAHKVLATDISQTRNAIAVASLNCFFVYTL